MKILVHFLLFVFCNAFPFLVFPFQKTDEGGYQYSPRRYVVHKLLDSIVFDGKLDEIYWKLRQVYYLEHEFKKKTGQFTDQIRDLGLRETFYKNVKIVLKDSVFLVLMPHKNNYIYLQSDSKIFIK